MTSARSVPDSASRKRSSKTSSPVVSTRVGEQPLVRADQGEPQVDVRRVALQLGRVEQHVPRCRLTVINLTLACKHGDTIARTHFQMG